MENWSVIKKYPKYEINENGDIKSSYTGRLLKPSSVKGYMKVALYDETGAHRRYGHDLVADTFLADDPNRTQVNHIDGNKSNNHVSNLERCTCRENVQHAIKTGLRKPYVGREKVPVRIVETGEVYDSIRDCSIAINGNRAHICDCVTGKRSTHKGLRFEAI